MSSLANGESEAKGYFLNQSQRGVCDAWDPHCSRSYTNGGKWMTLSLSLSVSLSLSHDLSFFFCYFIIPANSLFPFDSAVTLFFLFPTSDWVLSYLCPSSSAAPSLRLMPTGGGSALCISDGDACCLHSLQQWVQVLILWCIFNKFTWILSKKQNKKQKTKTQHTRMAECQHWLRKLLVCSNA